MSESDHEFTHGRIVERSIWRRVIDQRRVRRGVGLLSCLGALALLAPLLGVMEPDTLDPNVANLPPGAVADVQTIAGEAFRHRFMLGSDALGRDLLSRVLHGARTSLFIGACATAIAVLAGLAAGLAAGYWRRVDFWLTGMMDGVMALPAVLFALTVMSISDRSVAAVIVALAIPEIPRMARLVRSRVLSLREEPYVEASMALGSSPWSVLSRHIVPGVAGPVSVQAVQVAATAILLESALSFLGAGLPAERVTWGSMLALGWSQLAEHPHGVLVPAVILALTVHALNTVGDGLLEALE